MDVASLDKARQLMRTQKEGERHLNIRPAFVLVPTALESVTNQVIRSTSVKGADINAGIINPVKDFATVIAEPRLDDNSQSTFYLAAAKGTDTIEVAYLNGVDTPYTLTTSLHDPLPPGAVIHIVPRLAGAKSGGVFQAVLGAALIAVAWWNPAGWLGAAAV